MGRRVGGTPVNPLYLGYSSRAAGRPRPGPVSRRLNWQVGPGGSGGEDLPRASWWDCRLPGTASGDQNVGTDGSPPRERTESLGKCQADASSAPPPAHPGVQLLTQWVILSIV